MGQEVAIVLASAASWLAGWGLLAKMRAGRARFDESGNSAQSVSILIPARNEAHNLPKLLASLQRQSFRPMEVIVIDDGSTDATAEIAATFGAKVIPSSPLPEGWRGKPWACHQGALLARGDLLMFLDADTWLEPDGLGKIMAGYTGGALSVAPHHVIEKPYEQLSAMFNLTMVAGTVPHGLLGQMLLVGRESYRRAGGHESVKGKVLENFRLAEHFREAGIPVRSVIGMGLLSFRMYPGGLGELIEGWTKGFASGAGQTSKSVLLLVSLWMGGLFLPLALIPISPLAPWIYLAASLQLAILLRQVGRFSWITALLYPVALMFYLIVLMRSALKSGKEVTWKGRTIHGD
ncbi:MAG: glycosyl transferase family 2 [Verrucomicrobiales bacterium VVV1]|nr:MAG: glycosyl transferase family 2 [Verrucomicrobiales bacterium VVV1]